MCAQGVVLSRGAKWLKHHTLHQAQQRHARHVKTFGQAYMTHRWQRQLHTKIGKEQDVFAGFSRMMLDRFSDEPVLYLTDCGKAAAIVLTNQQQASLIEALQSMDFSIIHGTLQMLVAIPEDSIPAVRTELEETHKAAADVVQNVDRGGLHKQIVLIGTQPEAQGKGLASALMHAITSEADKQHHMLLAEAPDESGVGFYAKFGFDVVGRRELRPLMMRKVL
eukprot:GHUV01006703.1.p1 GENE.GHUV01006703.1~~GHUV01006703.1.p1  ORF type:complete len:222 (+),score=38.34 GHUV01006703.1:490-1155(+)